MTIQRRVSKLETTSGTNKPPRNDEFSLEALQKHREYIEALTARCARFNSDLAPERGFDDETNPELIALLKRMSDERAQERARARLSELNAEDLRVSQLVEARQKHARRLKRDDDVERGSFSSAGEAEEESGAGIDWSEAGTLARSSQLPEELRRVIVRGRGK